MVWGKPQKSVVTVAVPAEILIGYLPNKSRQFTAGDSLVGGDFAAADDDGDDDNITRGYLLNSCYTSDYLTKDIVHIGTMFR